MSWKALVGGSGVGLLNLLLNCGSSRTLLSFFACLSAIIRCLFLLIKVDFDLTFAVNKDLV